MERQLRIAKLDKPKHHLLRNWSFVRLLAGSLLLSGVAEPWAESYSLPVAVNPLPAHSLVIPELANPGSHPGIANIGHASGTYSANGQNLTVHQTTENVVLDWSSFNIAAGNSVQFVQPDSAAVALNNIKQADASQIFGSLQANGQVYLVNANGFIFGPHAEVNSNSLVASSLAISDQVFQQGITNAVDSNASPNDTTPVAALTGNGAVYLNKSTGEKIGIWVEKGATINADKNGGGRVLLVAPEVENDGTINAPQGQVILAAATDKVYLQSYRSSDLRGLLVEVQTGGEVKNVGSILTKLGNTTLIGFVAAQQGIISASTSVALNGSVRLLAREGAQLQINSNPNITTSSSYILEPISTSRSADNGDQLGTQAAVTLAAGSSTQVTLDASGGTALTGQAQPQSVVEVEADFIDMQKNAKITAPGGIVDLMASSSNQGLSSINDGAGTSALTSSTANNSRIKLETGSSIDVSGVQNVPMSMDSNVVNLTLYSNELRNDPYQKNGALYGKNVQIDIRQGTQIADISGFIANIRYPVDYRNINAGTVNLNSEGSVLVQNGANIHINGGSVKYAGGDITTSYLVSNGIPYSISAANPALIYQKILSESTRQTGYTQGGNAGTVNIYSRDLILDGNLHAATQSDQYQRSNVAVTPPGETSINYTDVAPLGGRLNINLNWSGLPPSQDVIFQNTQQYTPIPKTGGVTSPLYLSNALFGNGLNGLSLITGGKFTINKDTALSIGDFGALSLQANTIEMLGSIVATDGRVNLSSGSGGLHLAAGSSIDTSGLWINDTFAAPTANPALLAINGGSISLQAQGDMQLDKGSQLAANGGGWLQQYNKLSRSGLGGSISLSVAANSNPSVLQLNAGLSAYALNQGGALSITANAITIADNPANLAQDQFTLYLASQLLESGGFSAYKLTANAGNISVIAGSHINLQQTNWQLQTTAGASPLATPNVSLQTWSFLPQNYYPPNSVNLDLIVAQSPAIGGYVADRSISIGSQAVISANPNAAISLTSDANITIDGTLSALVGSINVNIVPPSSSIDSGYNPNQAVSLGADAVLSAAGAPMLTFNNVGLNLGNVLDGGTVNITANRGYILTAAGSLIDVSGSNAALDYLNTQGIHLRQNIASNGGTVNLNAAEGMILEGGFSALAGKGVAAGGSGTVTVGGSLDISLNALNRGNLGNIVYPTSDRNIHISTYPVNFLGLIQSDKGELIIPDKLNGLAYLSAQQISLGGFDNLTLGSLVNSQGSAQQYEPSGGGVYFDGNVSLSTKLSMVLDAPQIADSSGNPGSVWLNTDMFTLGSSLNQAVLGSLSNPSSANNVFSVNAANIDLQGSVLINGFAQTALNSTGDIRLIGINPYSARNLLGSLDMTGQLILSAREIYPVTMSQYTISVDAALSPDGSVIIQPTVGSAYTPLSAGGALSITAANITSYGNLLAPFGTISLTAPNSLTLAAGSLTSVANADGVMIPFGQTQGNGLAWIYPLGLNANIQSGTPQKQITLNAPDMKLQSGSAVNLNGSSIKLCGPTKIVCGGDLTAYEFIPGPGGDSDYLLPGSAGYQKNYAILPGLKSAYAPYDALEFPGSGLSLGQNIYLSAASGVPVGYYVLLPAHYALLPGAYLITPVTGSTDMAAGATLSTSYGAEVVAGYLTIAGSNAAAGRYSGFIVQPGSAAQTYAQYQLSGASRFFASSSSVGVIPSLPQDAGNLTLLAGQTLNLLSGIQATAAANGLGGLLDISANQLEITKCGDAVSNVDAVILDYAELNKLGVDSIFIGGYRTRTANNTLLTVSAQSVTVDAGVQLQAPEILLAADNSVTINNGAAISAVGSLSRTDTLLKVANADSSSTDGALLRVSAAGQAEVTRSHSGTNSTTGILTIAAGANLSSSGSILLDASKTGEFSGGIQMPQGQLTLSAGLITLGGAANANTGLQLSDAVLNQFHVSNLVLKSYTNIDLAGALNLNLRNLTLDAAGIAGYGSGGQTAKIQAGSITLQNSADTIAALAGTGTGQFQLQADTLTLAAGQYALSGFSNIKLLANTTLTDSGAGNITANGNVAISAQLWTAVSGAATSLNLGANTLSVSGKGGQSGASGLGASLTLTAGEIDFSGIIAMHSGQVNLHASKLLNIEPGAVIDASGAIVSLNGNQAYSPGGSISLLSSAGDITVQNGAVLNVSGSKSGGSAGSLSLYAAKGNVSLAGTISGFGYQGASGGNFSLDALTTSFSGFSALNKMPEAGGFNGNLTVQLGQGDLLINATDKVNAANITLTADNGVIDVSGKLDVRAAQAGTILLSANGGVTIEKGASLSASSSGAGNKGGKVVLTSDPVNGAGSGVTLAAGSIINVAGASGGSVQVIANQLGANDAAVNIDSGAVLLGAASMTVTAMAHYLNAQLSNAQILQWFNATQSYLNNAGQNSALQTRLDGFTLQPGYDIQSQSSLTLNLSETLPGMTAGINLIGNNAISWTQVSPNSKIFYTNLSNVTSTIGSLLEITKANVGEAFTAANSSVLTKDGTYFFDSNPQSSTFQDLFVQIFPNTGSTNTLKYNPNLITGSLMESAWTPLTNNATNKVFYINLSDVAGAVGAMQEISTTNAVQSFTATALSACSLSSCALTANGSYYFDSDPQSPTFRDLFVQIYPYTAKTYSLSSNTLKYNPIFINGSLVEYNGWDLALPYTANPNPSALETLSSPPGLLSIRSAGNINLDQNLSDGFAIYDSTSINTLLGLSGQWLPTLVLQSGPSWSYNIVAGADLSSANLHDTNASTASGALTIGANTSIRTGTGDIYLGAAADIALTDWTSTVYTAGQAALSNRYGSLNSTFVGYDFFVEYPTGGGDVTMNAGGDIIGANTPQLMSDWLQHIGNWNPVIGEWDFFGISTANLPTAWGIDFGGLLTQQINNSTVMNTTYGFRENIGALGGGNVNIRAGGTILNLSVMLPTTAKPVGALDANGVLTQKIWLEQGGGNLNLAAGGNIEGGVFYVEKGAANISAAAAITGGSQYTPGPIFALGDAQFNVQAASGIQVGTVMNPFVLTQANISNGQSYFTTYTADSGITLQTLGGDIVLNNNTSLIQQQYLEFIGKTARSAKIITTSLDLQLLTLYPGNLTAYALSGNLQIAHSMYLYPAAGSSFNLEAAGNITLADNVILSQLDVDPNLLLSSVEPSSAVSNATLYLNYYQSAGDGVSTVHAAQPIHAGNTQANQIVAGGSIIGQGNNVLINAAKVSDISASGDLNNLSLKIQNINPQDVSIINIGGNILYPLQRDSAGNVIAASLGIQLAGPGLLDVWAGGNIDLGSSAGITTVGGLLNPALPSAGADITVLAGNQLGGNNQSLNKFLQFYLTPGYQQSLSAQLAALLQQTSGNANSQLATNLKNLLDLITTAPADLLTQTTLSGRLQIALGILFDQIRLATTEAATSQGIAQQQAYQSGYDAINLLFPNNPGGNITLDFSQIQTLEGGNINLLAPGGMINVGLSSSDVSSNKTAAQLGVVADLQGSINILTQGDLQVNQSRVFTLDSGDITAWSSYGNIDAGRGAKSSIATQAPIVSFDAQGNLIVQFPATVSGSGIREESGFNSTQIGNVYLAAPHGIVNADEAGIGGYNVTIAATAVIGVSNIQVLGTGFGIPQTQTSIALPDSIGNAAAAAVGKSAVADLLEEDRNASQQRANNAAKLALFNTQVLGFGNCSVSDVREGAPGCGGK